LKVSLASGVCALCCCESHKENWKRLYPPKITARHSCIRISQRELKVTRKPCLAMNTAVWISQRELKV